MVTLTRTPLNPLITMCCSSLLICSLISSNVCGASKDITTYKEIKKDGRIYVFTSFKRMGDFKKSGELGRGIIKIGHGQNGETVVFGSDEAMFEYESRQVKQILGNLKIEACQEFEKGGRIHVFTSPERKASFENSGEMGKDYIAKIGYSSHGKTVMFDSYDAVKEYDSRHEALIDKDSAESNYFREIEKDGRVYVFTSPERLISYKRSGELGKGIIKVGYGQNGESVIFDSDEAVNEYERRNIR